MSTPSRRILLAALATFTAIALTMAPATTALLTEGNPSAGKEMLVGFSPKVDVPLIEGAGGVHLRTIPKLNIAVVYAAEPVTFTSLMLRAATVDFVKVNSPLHLDGSTWDGSSWDGSTWDGSSWDGSTWDGTDWDGSTWDGSSWDGSTWDGATWDGATWDGSTWDGSTWDGATWDGSTWDGTDWDGSSWDGTDWDGATWNWGAMDPGYPHQWGLGASNAPDAWAHTTGSHAFTICVLDTGVDTTHPDLAPTLWRDPSGRFGINVMAPGSDATDDVGHGTHVAGIIGAVAANGTGITGMAQEVILPIKVMDKNGGTEADLATGLVKCAQNGGNIASMSLHVTEQSEALERAIDHAEKKGVLMVAASGNAGASTVNFPASDARVMAVGAVKPDGAVAAFSNGGDGLSLVAPGVWIASAYPGGEYRSGSGTSQATPFVSAAAALVWETDPTLSAQEVRQTLEDSARDLGAAGWDARSGHGALDAGAAVAAAASAT